MTQQVENVGAHHVDVEGACTQAPIEHPDVADAAADCCFSPPQPASIYATLCIPIFGWIVCLCYLLIESIQETYPEAEFCCSSQSIPEGGNKDPDS